MTIGIGLVSPPFNVIKVVAYRDRFPSFFAAFFPLSIRPFIRVITGVITESPRGGGVDHLAPVGAVVRNLLKQFHQLGGSAKKDNNLVMMTPC